MNSVMIDIPVIQKKKKVEYSSYLFNIDTEIYKRLRAHCSQTGNHLSDILRALCLAYLSTIEIGEPIPPYEKTELEK